ncbi:MAG: hypothetical protein SFU85_03810 [Candidatus Methylacidiphilales bacterium]|nr:hypothetical protein [Candidatus Methylacidiphilales bacterium]
MTHSRKSLEEATLYALAMGCPRCAEAADCPMRPIQGLPYGRRFTAVDALSREERAQVLEHSGTCLGCMSPNTLRDGPFVESLMLWRDVQQRIGTSQEREEDLETAVNSAHTVRNALMAMAARPWPVSA